MGSHCNSRTDREGELGGLVQLKPEGDARVVCCGDCGSVVTEGVILNRRVKQQPDSVVFVVLSMCEKERERERPRRQGRDRSGGSW